MGRVCYHPCETACNRGQLDEAVGINSVERFLGDEAIRQRLDGRAAARRRTGKRVLVVGAGPSGLSAAYHLALLGHDGRRSTTPAPSAGGMMRFGIPRYRLPRDVLDAEVERILALGVDAAPRQQGRRPRGHDARRALRRRLRRRRRAPRQARLHPGRQRRARCSTRSRCCAAWRASEPPRLGRRVVVYGGGNTAMDAARTARRLGAEEAVVVYRRTRDRMPAHDSEVEEALAGGRAHEVAVDRPPRRRRQAGARADGARRRRASRSRPASSRSSRPTRSCSPSARSADLSLLERRRRRRASRTGSCEVGEDLMTGRPGVFAGGDIVPAERTVTMAIGHGRTAARATRRLAARRAPRRRPRRRSSPTSTR